MIPISTQKRLLNFPIYGLILECSFCFLWEFRIILDKFDFAILGVLQRDARASLQDVSTRVVLSTTPC